MLRKVLIANRGEIAVRVIRACREMGIGTVAVYSEADAEAPHACLADEAVLIGEAPAAQSYLRVERLLEAAAQTGCDSVHPGYGFLSENAGFAEAVEAAGLRFIGPPAAAIRAMGDKTAARAAMEAAGVPVVPGYAGSDREGIHAAARSQGFPVLVKASAGGGGKGMRVVEREADLDDAIAGAQREATAAFSDGRVYLEKYLSGARHVEIQILADSFGDVVHLGERECSVQRRHQKIVEEAPSPLVDEALREQMGDAAIAAARAVGYVNAGTIEFLVDAERSFYFLEMNTRLQVEHPVTELVTGIDLVHAQLRVAAGERLGLIREAIAPRGHAIECRVYAEDPAAGHLPASGRIHEWVPPSGPGIRVDAGIRSGWEVSHHYDPILAKIVTWAEDREGAIRRMDQALAQCVVLGIPTNLEFLRDVIGHARFLEGRVTTAFVETELADWAPSEDVPAEAFIAAALAQVSRAQVGGGESALPDPYSPWRSGDGFRLSETSG